MGALFSFIGGSAFRMIWGEVSSYFTKRQEHKQQIELLRMQAEMDDKRHSRDQERIRLQAELKVQEVQIAGDLAIQKTEADAFVVAMQNAMKPIGIWWVDAWNGSIRPAMASVALALWVLALYRANFVPTGWDLELIGGILGFYVADRSLGKRGK